MAHAALVWNGDLAIDHDWMAGCSQGTERMAKQRRPIDAIAAQKHRRTAARDDRDEPMPSCLISCNHPSPSGGFSAM
jgi:hypothetical protein